MMKYLYPAIFMPDDEGKIIVTFPDIPDVETFGTSMADAYYMAEDALALWLWNAEEEKRAIPIPSDLQALASHLDVTVSWISADTYEYKCKHDVQPVKKTLTIPRWLNTEAELRGLNFSQLLQKALKRELGK